MRGEITLEYVIWDLKILTFIDGEPLKADLLLRGATAIPIFTKKIYTDGRPAFKEHKLSATSTAAVHVSAELELTHSCPKFLPSQSFTTDRIGRRTNTTAYNTN